MIVGGVVFRVVTALHPGCPKLDAAGAPEIRAEYLATEFDPPEWTLLHLKAFVFVSRVDAEIRAKALGERCHVSTRRLPDSEIPERLRPLPDVQILPPPLAYPSKKKQRRPIVKPPPRVMSGSRRDWVTETYG